MSDDLRFNECLPDPCGCETCNAGQQILVATLSLGYAPLPLPFYQCVDSGGMLDRPSEIQPNTVIDEQDAES